MFDCTLLRPTLSPSIVRVAGQFTVIQTHCPNHSGQFRFSLVHASYHTFHFTICVGLCVQKTWITINTRAAPLQHLPSMNIHVTILPGFVCFVPMARFLIEKSEKARDLSLIITPTCTTPRHIPQKASRLPISFTHR